MTLKIQSMNRLCMTCHSYCSNISIVPLSVWCACSRPPHNFCHFPVDMIIYFVLNQHLQSRYTPDVHCAILSIFPHDICITGCSLTDLALTDTVRHCADRGFTNTLHISSGVVCYSTTVAGSEAVYSCDDGFHWDNTEMRVCQGNGIWNGSVSQCLRDSEQDGIAFLSVHYMSWIDLCACRLF